MKKHVKIYLSYFGYGMDDKPICENCGKAVINDIHHIDNKRMGGSKEKDHIANLIGLCRECHTDAHAEKISKSELIQIHSTNLIK